MFLTLLERQGVGHDEQGVVVVVHVAGFGINDLGDREPEFIGKRVAQINVGVVAVIGFEVPGTDGDAVFVVAGTAGGGGVVVVVVAVVCCVCGVVWCLCVCVCVCVCVVCVWCGVCVRVCVCVWGLLYVCGAWGERVCGCGCDSCS